MASTKRYPLNQCSILPLVCLFCLAGTFISSGQSNDNFANRKKIKGSTYSTHVDNSRATAEPLETHNIAFFTAPNHSLWWSWTAPQDEVICISTRGSKINAELIVYQGETLDTLTPVASSVDYNIGEVVFRAHMGVTYQITVDSFWYGSTGKIALSLFPPKVPINDDFTNRQRLAGNAVVSGCNRFASIEDGESYFQAITATLWYSWKAPKSGVLKLNFSERKIDLHRLHYINVFTGNAITNLTRQLQGAPGSIYNGPIYLNVTKGIEYQISVGCIQQLGTGITQPADSTFNLKLGFSSE